MNTKPIEGILPYELVEKSNRMHPGQHLRLSELVRLRCVPAKPHESGKNCQLCAFRFVDCERVNCLKGSPMPGGEGERDCDVSFNIYLALAKAKPKKPHPRDKKKAHEGASRRR